MSPFKNYDVLISIFAALSIPAIGIFRQVCRETLEASRQWTVWYNACNIHILQRGIPCSRSDLKSLSASELERQTIRAYLLRENLSSPISRISEEPWTIPYGCATKFVKTQSRTWIVHVSGSDDLDDPYTVCLLDCATGDVVSRYSLGDDFDVRLRIHTQKQHWLSLWKLLSIHEDHTTSTVSLDCVYRMEDSSKILTSLHGDMLAFTRQGGYGTLSIKNWKTEDPPLELTGIYDTHTMAFIGQDILVIGTGFTYLFMPPYEEPRCKLLTHSRATSFSFEPMSSEKGVSSSLTSILVQDKRRPRTTFQLFKIPDLPGGEGERAGGPFAPLVQMSMGELSCMQSLDPRSLYHGPAGTAAWVNNIGLEEATLVVVAFPGYYNETNEVQLRVERPLDGGYVAYCCDYDEVEGRVIVRESDMTLKVYSLCSFDESRFAWKRMVEAA